MELSTELAGTLSLLTLKNVPRTLDATHMNLLIKPVSLFTASS